MNPHRLNKGRLLRVATLSSLLAIGTWLPSNLMAQEAIFLTEAFDVPSQDISIQYPANWSLAPQQFINSYKLINITTKAHGKKKITARVKLSIEPRRNHAEALVHLQQLGTGLGAPASAYQEIGGWPALQYSHLEMRPQPSKGPAFADIKVLRVTTAVAAGKLLVYANGSLPSDASEQMIGEAEAIGKSLAFGFASHVESTQSELKALRASAQEAAPRSAAPLSEATAVVSSDDPLPGFNDRVFATGFGEVEIAVSPDGQNVVIGRQGDWVASNDGGQTFPLTGSVGAFDGGDPSVAYAVSGAFYYAGIDRGCQAADATGPYGYSCTGMARSTDNGATFPLGNPAVVCPNADPDNLVVVPGSCFPDQEHIAADRVNAAAGDQVYSTWRNFDASDQDAGLVCSQDSGVNWTAPLDLGGSSFFPRIWAAQDGFVYVAAYGGQHRLWKFSSCANGLVLQTGFPVNVAARTEVECPFAGHDRCDQNPTSQVVAVDDINPNHVYYAYGANIAAGNDNILVRDSIDGGLTWTRPAVPVHSSIPGKRIMPWLCTTGGDAYLSWYDRRNASPLQNDATDYYAARAGLNDVGALVPKGEFMVSEVPDNWCDSGWPCGTRQAPSASESCSVQPQLAGICRDGANNNTGRCDFSDCGGVGNNGGPPCQCPGGSTCEGGNGCPKYGDYNGNACVAGRFYAAWASASQPAGVPPPNPTRIGILFDFFLIGDVPQIQIPGAVSFDDTCTGNDSVAELKVCNTGNSNLHIKSIVSSDLQFSVTDPLAGYPVTISPDFCFDFEVEFSPTTAGDKLAVLTVTSDDPANLTIDVDVDATAAAPEVTATLEGNGDFGQVKVGLDRVLNLQVSNASSICELEVTDLTRTSGDTQFTFAGLPAPQTFPVTLPVGSNLDLPIKFAPTDLLAKTAVFTLTTDAPPPLDFTVTGASQAPDIELTGNLEFGEVCALDQLEKTVQICNLGELNTLNVTDVSLVGSGCGDFTLVNPPATPFDVSHDFCVNVTARYTPPAVGSHNFCELVVASNDPDEPTVSIPLTGTAPPPDINVAIANSGDFGEVCKGTFKDLDLTLFNQGKCNLTITEISSDNALFELPADTQFPLVLSPDADFTSYVRFAPEVCDDTPATGTITIKSDSPGETELDVGVSGVSPCPNLVIDPIAVTGMYSFPATVVDADSSLGCFTDQSVTLRNTGNCPLTISDISAAGDIDPNDYAVIAPTVLPIILPTGEETLDVTIRFTPQADDDPLLPSEVLGMLTIVSDDPNFPHEADLCGESVTQSGVRILVTDVSTGIPDPVVEVDSIDISSKGKKMPSPIKLQFTDQLLETATVCDNEFEYHVNLETLPSTGTTGSNPKSSYAAKAREGNLQTEESFKLGQCEFREFQLELRDSDAQSCVLGAKGDSCETDVECCSFKCKGPSGGKSCK